MSSGAIRLPAEFAWTLREQTRRRGFWVNFACAAFLVIVPLGIVVLLLSNATGTYTGGNGSSDCLIAGYPTNIDRCARQ